MTKYGKVITTSVRTGVRSVLLHVSGVQKQTGCQPVRVIYARPSIPVIPDFPSDIPAVFWNFVYLVSHCVWDLLSTCETRSVPVRGEAASCNKPDSLPELCVRNFWRSCIQNKSISNSHLKKINNECPNCLQSSVKDLVR